MSGAHEPREEFVNQLELRIRDDLRRGPATGSFSWMPQSKLAVAFATTVIVIVSMVIGGGAVAAAYETRLNQQRELILQSFEQRAAIAKQRLALAAQQLQDMQQRVSVGTEKPESVPEAQFKVAEAEAALKSIELDIAEITATGREPMNGVSAPLVAGRDFVTERWRVEMSVPTAALQLEKTRTQAARTRVEVGLANPLDVDEAQTKLMELEAVLEGFQRKIGIRQTFLMGGLQPAVAELRALEAETEVRRAALARRVDFARRQVQDLKTRFSVGTSSPLEVAEAELRVQELQLAMTKADYELALIRKQLGK
jgi:hypothetical protein